MNKIGDRVGAILSTKGDEIHFLGWGVYEGNFLPVEAVGWLAEELCARQRPNPRIRLDSGKVVYGCECWWGGEEKIKEQLSKFKVVKDVDINEARGKVEK